MDDQQWSDRQVAGLVVVGGGPAALEAARAFRAAGGQGVVEMFSDDEHPPYHRPPLSKDYLRGQSQADALPLEQEQFYFDTWIDLYLRTRAIRLDPEARALRLQGGRTVGYDVLVLATGGEPSRLPVPGGDHPDLLHLRSWTDAAHLRAAAARARSAVVVGSGFIGCEVAASLGARGLEVTMVTQEKLPQQERLGEEAADRIAGWLAEYGVRLVAGADVGAVEDGRSVVLADGSLSADLVLVAAGITPRVELAEEAGAACEGGRIRVDASMRTSLPGVFAAGDVVLADNASAGRALPVEHWGDALRMGEVAGTCAAGGADVWAEVPGFWSEIGGRTVKYAAWGDGFDECELEERPGGFTVWYARDGVTVGVLTHGADDDYERGRRLVEGSAGFAAEQT